MKQLSRFIALLLLVGAVACALPANAYVYSGKRKIINCGVVVLNNGADTEPGTTDSNGIPGTSSGR